jgi:antitoxin component HigA of HigAB toxin-antitoxin module
MVSTITSSLLLALRLENIDCALKIGRYHHKKILKMTATAKTNKKPLGDRPSKPSKLDPAKYGRLLAETLPAVITNESEYDRVAPPLMNKLAVIPEDRINPEQERLFDLLTLLIETYDEEHYQIPDAAPHEVIQLLMRERGLRNKDLDPPLPQPRRDIGGHQRQAQTEQDTD